MVDPITASVAVFLISSFLSKVGEGFANKVGENLADKTKQIYETLKDNFANDDYANLTLLRLEESPEDENRQVSLESVIKERMVKDANFADLLTRQTQDAKKFDKLKIIASGKRSIAVGGDVHSSNINTGNVYKNTELE